MIHVVKQIRIREQEGEYFLNLFSDVADAQGRPRLDLVLKLDFISKDIQGHQYDQQMTFEAPAGGLAETVDEYLYQAPENGYQDKYIYTITPMLLKDDGWKKKYYFKSRNGHIVGGLDVAFTLFPYVFQIDAVINPAGSRYLEPDSEKQITDPEEIRRLDLETAR